MSQAGDGVRSALGWAAIIVGALSFTFLGYEWWTFVVRHDLQRARLYPFGTEQGWNYCNPTVYGWSALEAGSLALLTAILLRLALVRRSRRWLAGAGLVYGAGVAFEQVCGSLHWSVWHG